MSTVFLTCVAVGGVILVVQVLLGFLGLESDVDVDTPDLELDADDLGQGLELLSVRSLSAAVAVFGASGLYLETLVPAWMAVVLAVVPGFAAAWLTAAATRWMLEMESSGSLDLGRAIGQEAKVYLTVPVGGEKAGLVHVPLQGRVVELRAVTREGEALPSGSSVTIMGLVEGSETVEVISTTSFERELHDDDR